MTVELSAVILVDRSGRILLQLRDGQAPVWPDRWALPGGHIEPGETPLECAHRELWEETGLRPDGPLTLYATQELPPAPGHTEARRKHYLIGATSAGPADVVLGEGAAMVFTTPADALDGRTYTPGTAELLAGFFDAPEYRALRRT